MDLVIGAGVLDLAVGGVVVELIEVGGALGLLIPKAGAPLGLGFGATEVRTLLTLRAAPFVTVVVGLTGLLDGAEERTRGAATTDERGDTTGGGD